MSSGTPAKTTLPAVALVLGGGGREDPLARSAGVPSKSLVPFEGRPLADHVLSALRASRHVGSIIYVGDHSDRLQPVDYRVPSGRLFSDSFSLGLGAALATSPGSRILMCTADLPWLTATAIDRFVESSRAALSYPIIPREVALAEFPQQKRTFVKLRQGHVTGGNLVLLDPQIVPALLLLTDRFYAARKNPIALSSLLGLDTLLALLLGRADLGKLEEKVSRMLGAPVEAVISQDACLGADVDKPGQLPAAQAPARG